MRALLDTHTFLMGRLRTTRGFPAGRTKYLPAAKPLAERGQRLGDT